MPSFNIASLSFIVCIMHHPSPPGHRPMTQFNIPQQLELKGVIDSSDLVQFNINSIQYLRDKEE
jgi:hypothetical protein